MRIKNPSLILFLVLALISCHTQPHIDTFDAISWQGDPNGCRGDRLNQLTVLMDGQDKLLGWTEPKITGYLGSPDYRELYLRNQKFLIYFLEPTLDCGPDGKENPLRMYVRMDALGQSKEISLRNR